MDHATWFLIFHENIKVSDINMIIKDKLAVDIINLLSHNMKMTSSAISKKLNISLSDTIRILLRLETQMFLTQLNGFWFSTDTLKSNDALIKYFEILKETGAMSAAEIAFITGSTPSAIARNLSRYVRKGEIVRYRKDSTYFYEIVPGAIYMDKWH